MFVRFGGRRGLVTLTLGTVTLACVAMALWAVGIGGSSVARADDSAAPSCSAGMTVTTLSGPVCGFAANSDQNYLGIPYAAPPVGNLRWAPPQAPTPWTTTLPATAYGSECAQAAGGTVAGSENCLFLNVVRPDDTSTNLPVLVHIHAGGFTSASAQPIGGGDYSLIANSGHAVVVSMNYRLGIFGFLANKTLGPNAGDYGLQDQQFALQWVKQNIAKFGGDPDNVTIYGESAGGSSVCDQIASPTAKGLFNRAISVSGEYNTLLGSPTSLESQDCKSALPTAGQAQAAGKTFAASVGCGSGTADVAACLRGLTAAQVEAAAGSGYEDGGQGTIGPTINGSTLTMSLRQALRNGKVNKVPVMAGVGRDEDLVGTATTAAQYQSLVDAQYGAHASQVLTRYPLSHFDSPAIAWRTVAADSDTVCPALGTDADLATRMPTYGFEIDDNDLSPYPTTPPPAGAEHIGAWNYIYSGTVYGGTTPLDANQQALQDELLTTIGGFALNGDTSPQGTPTWPQFNRGQEVLSLQPAGDSELISTAELSAQHDCGFWDKLVPNP
jgi:para-nitrobenzyl esterase